MSVCVCADACQLSPARLPAGITVAASDKTDTRWTSSNYGSCVDLYAPGVAVLSAMDTSDTATMTASGTSMACPHVSGVAALYLQSNPTAQPNEVRSDSSYQPNTPEFLSQECGACRLSPCVKSGSYTFTATLLHSCKMVIPWSDS